MSSAVKRCRATRVNFRNMTEEQIVDQLRREESVGKYRALSILDSVRVRRHYKKLLPAFLNINGCSDCKLFMKSTGELLARGYSRVVIGDHGAYIEIEQEDINVEILRIKKGEERRMKPNPYYKYVWLETSSGDKVYKQLAGVKYADYKCGFYYIDPTLVFVK